MKKKYIVLILLASAALIILIVSSFFSSKKIEAVKLEKGNLITVVYATGRVTADTIATLRSISGGIVQYVNAAEGSNVKKGQLLLKTDQAAPILSLKSAESDLNTAKVELQNDELDFKRKNRLKATNSISENDFDNAKKTYELAKLKLEQQQILVDKAKQNLSDTEIYSPFDGVITASRVNQGDYLQPGSECFEIVFPKSIVVEGDVDEQDLSKLSIGQKSVVAFDAFPGKSFDAYVFRIVPKTNRETKTSKVFLRLLHKPLKLNVGMTSTVNIETGRINNVILIPRTAILNDGSEDFVYLINSQNRLQKVNVEVGSDYNGKFTDLLKGSLKEGDYIADNPSLQLKDGTKVEMIIKK